MKNFMSKALCLTSLCAVAITTVHAEELSKAELNKQVQVCKHKAQNDQVSYKQNGILFNGTCQPNVDGKLAFTPPQPVSEGSTATPDSTTPPPPPADGATPPPPADGATPPPPPADGATPPEATEQQPAAVDPTLATPAEGASAAPEAMVPSSAEPTPAVDATPTAADAELPAQ